MTPGRWRRLLHRGLDQPRLNFLLTNRIPRRHLTRFMGWFSRIEHPWISHCSIALWRFFADVDLSDARLRRFASLHAAFIRELREGARPIDLNPETLVSPCDGVIGAHGAIRDGLVLQAKGRAYALAELLTDAQLARGYAGGLYMTLRLTAGMYHRFHAPYDCTVERVTYVPGDVWNVNPPALERVDRLYCRNERAVLQCRLASSGLITLVPVAAILVSSLRLHCLPPQRSPGRSPARITDCAAAYHKGEELGWFEHGSTIIVLAPAGCGFLAGLRVGERVRVGQPLISLPAETMEDGMPNDH